MDSEQKAYKKLKHLKEILGGLHTVAIAFSGGVDSAFLLKAAAHALGDGAVAITARSAIHPQRETEYAIRFALKTGVRHLLLDSDELAIPEFVRNPKNRCYICKRSLFWKIRDKAGELGIRTVAEGSNVDDLSDFRPGMRAIKELGVISPLLEAGFNKSEIRFLSKEMELETWDKQPLACLATRFPYGEKISIEKLKMVDACERVLLNLGFKQVRVRHHGNLARIEVGRDERVRFFKDGIADLADEACRRAGFTYCTIDAIGYRTGSMNQADAREGHDE